MIRSRLFISSIYSGIFILMALSNAIIPIMPALENELHVQALIFSAYFFGAMLITFPAGLVSDRVGQIPVIITGLLLTSITGSFLLLTTDSLMIILLRFFEGIGAGLFVAASLSWINYQASHVRLSGYFMATMNLGLLAGLMAGGWLTELTHDLSHGILIFTLLSFIPLGMGCIFVFLKNRNRTEMRWTSEDSDLQTLIHDAGGMILRQAPLWYSVIILLGITGFVQAFFPELSGLSSSEIGTALACMNLATIITSLLAPRLRFEPVLMIRISAIMMGVLALVFVQIHISVFLIGGLAGLIMVSQINYLAAAEEHQGVAMGLFSTSSYAGMTLIPSIGGQITSISSFMTASVFICMLALICVIIIGRCRCRGFILSGLDDGR